MPVVNGQLLDLVALLGAITKRGGVRRVQDQRLWNEVGIPTSLIIRPAAVNRDGMASTRRCLVLRDKHVCG